ncbi:MAG: hypothetical protein C3F11_16605 [Methylocystaceae bacterium]|nr:MAG: hypothetical protein C3F11_16605 [Methylocystaceae bacterium]
MDYELSPKGRGSARAVARGKRAAAPQEPDPQKAPRRRVEVLESYFGADGKPVKRKSLGAARVARRYDERGNKVEEAYFSADGKPTLRKGLGAARIAWRYDERGKQIEAAFFGADGKLIDKGAATSRGRLLEDA